MSFLSLGFLETQAGWKEWACAFLPYREDHRCDFPDFGTTFGDPDRGFGRRRAIVRGLRLRR